MLTAPVHSVFADEPGDPARRDILAVVGLAPDIQSNRLFTTIRSTNLTESIEAGREALAAGYSLGGLGVLQLAALFGDRDTIERLIGLGADPDDRADHRMPTPLHLALMTGDNDTATLLLDHGAAMDTGIGRGRSTLSLAAMFGHNPILARMLAAGISVNQPDPGGMTPLACAAKAGQYDTAAWLMAQGADVHARDPQGLTPLHYAAIGNHSNVVTLLLDNQADQGLPDRDGRTPVWLAVRLARLDALRALLAQPGFLGMADNEGRSPLMTAVTFGRHDVLNLLLESGADFAVRDDLQQTLLHHAVRMQATNSVAWLADHTDRDAQDSEGYTPLARAISMKHGELARLLIQRGSDVNRTNNAGYSPLMLAIDARGLSLVRPLLKAGADPNTSLPDGQTPVMLAAYAANCQTLDLLFAAGASATGFTQRGHGIFDFALEQTSTKNMECLLAHGVDPSVRAHPEKWPVVLTAAWRGREDVVNLLLDHGVDINTADYTGQTILMVALRRGHTALVHTLLQRGANPAKRALGFTAWHYAVDRQMTGLAETLAALTTPEQRMPTNRIMVYFDLDAPQASQVSVAGFFSEWNSETHPMRKREDDGWWYTEVEVFPLEYKYKFVVDGDWILDPLNDNETKDGNAGYTDSSFVATERTPDQRPDRPVSRPDTFKEITFELVTNAIRSASVAGTFNGWNTQALRLTPVSDDTWRGTIPLKPGDYAYKLVVDGRWILDPANPDTLEVDGVTNSMLRVDP